MQKPRKRATSRSPPQPETTEPLWLMRVSKLAYTHDAGVCAYRALGLRTRLRDALLEEPRWVELESIWIFIYLFIFSKQITCGYCINKRKFVNCVIRILIHYFKISLIVLRLFSDLWRNLLDTTYVLQPIGKDRTF